MSQKLNTAGRMSTNSEFVTIAVAIATIAYLAWKRKTDGKAMVKEARIDDPKTVSLCQSLKAELKLLLSKHNGCTKSKEVVELVEKLSAINPVPTNCSNSIHWIGDYYTLSAPSFPGRIVNDKTSLPQFTLGRLSFNVFQPNNLVCSIKSIRNPITVCNGNSDDESRGGTTFTYDIILDLIIHTPSDEDSNNDQHNGIQDSDIEAIMHNTAICYPSPDIDNRIMVTFTGSSLTPKNKNDKAMGLKWNKNFANAYRKADVERTVFGRLLRGGLKWFLGMTFPSDADSSDEEHVFSFEMKKPMTGYLDILYLDEDVRITKGNRGTIVVADRIKESTTTSEINMNSSPN